MMAYFNPYSGADLWQFILIFFTRLFSFDGSAFATDEIQVWVLVGVAISSSLVGCFLILRKMAMLANALSHTILLGIVLAYLITKSIVGIAEGDYGINLSAMLIASIATGVVTTFLTEVLHKVLKLQEDASIGLVFTTLFAVGIILVTLFTRNAHIGTEVVMGNADALQVSDLTLVWTIVVANALLFFLFFKEYQLTTFDSALAKALGFSPIFFNYLLMIQVSGTAIGAFRAVGVLMVLAFLVGPPLIARMLTHSLKVLLFLSMGIGIVTSFLGVALSRHILSVDGIALSTGGITVTLIAILYILVLFTSWLKGAWSRKSGHESCFN